MPCPKNPIAESTSQKLAGWHGDSFVYPGETFGPLANKLVHVGPNEIDPALGLRNGQLNDWREGLRRGCKSSDFSCSASPPQRPAH